MSTKVLHFYAYGLQKQVFLFALLEFTDLLPQGYHCDVDVPAASNVQTVPRPVPSCVE